MPRSPQQIPFANWLTSRDPALRERAETALYHLGPDGGTALFDAAERVTQPADYYSIFGRLLLQVLFWALIDWAIICLTHPNSLGMQIIFGMTIAQSIINAIESAIRTFLSRRRKLKVLGLALAKRNDLRAIGPLLEAWQPTGTLSKQRPDDEIEHELTRLMPQFLRQKSFDLRSYKKRHLRQKTRRLFRRRLVGGRLVPHADLSDQRADVVVTVLQILTRSNSEQDRALLESIAQLHPVTTNSQYVRDAALFCLESQTTTVSDERLVMESAPAPTHTAVSVGPAPVVIRR